MVIVQNLAHCGSSNGNLSAPRPLRVDHQRGGSSVGRGGRVGWGGGRHGGPSLGSRNSFIEVLVRFFNHGKRFTIQLFIYICIHGWVQW